MAEVEFSGPGMSTVSARSRLSVLTAHLLPLPVEQPLALETSCVSSQSLAQPPANLKGSLSIVDERTGKRYQIPVSEHGTVKSTDLKKISTGNNDKGLKLYDPGYLNTAPVRSSISYIDGDDGILRYRGYPIEELAESSSYLEVAYLLLFGNLPSKNQPQEWERVVMLHSAVPQGLLDMIQGMPHDAHPMGVLVSAMSALSVYHPDANPALRGQDLYKSKQVRAKQIVRILGKAPTIAAAAYLRLAGRPAVLPSENLSYAENFLYMLDSLGNRDYKPNPRLARRKIGMRCKVRANHFLIQINNSKDIHHYDVSIVAEGGSKEIQSKALCKKIMSELVKLYKQSELGNRIPAYDGKKSLYTGGPLPFESKKFIVPLPEDLQRKEKKFGVVIKKAVTIDPHQGSIQALDVVMRAAAPTDYVAIGRSFFSTKLGSDELGMGLEYWKGYYQSVRPVQMGLSLNVDASARAFYKPVIVTKFVAEFLNRRLSKQLTGQDRDMVKTALKGTYVETYYMGYTKCYKIESLSTERADQLKFNAGSGQISVSCHFFEKYGIKLQYPFLPCIKAEINTKPVYIPMELCKLVEAQRYMMKLNKDQVAKMLRATCQRPPEREQRIIQMVKDNRYNEIQLVAKEFGIQLSEQSTLVDARILPVPKLNYSNNQLVDPDLGQWKMNDKKFYSGATVKYWTCLNFSAIDQRNVSQFCKDIVDMCVSKGMDFNARPIVPIRDAVPDQIDRALREVHMEAKKQLQLLFVILPDFDGPHDTVKRICETELGVITQCCDLNKEMKNKRQYLENLSYKINIKTGGRNVALHAAVQRQIPLLTNKGEPTIVFGADVTHAKPNDSTPSVAAVVASMDWPEVTKYRALISAQGVREEIIQDLYTEQRDPQGGIIYGGMIRELLRSFYNETKQKPSRIIFYRDGVSEGQFAQVLLHEVLATRKACQSLQQDYAPRLTFIVVQKRHHTRLFSADRNMTDRSGNILPGTVVDTTICHPIQYDFYLCSHAGIQGTSRPTHYHVLLDENYFPPDLLQLMTYSLCYTYARCTRSVSLVPPAYYAHLAAFRARAYMAGEESDSGSMSRGESSTDSRRSVPRIIDSMKDVMYYC